MQTSKKLRDTPRANYHMVVNEPDRNAMVSVGGNGQYTLLNRLHQCVYVERHWNYPVTAVNHCQTRLNLGC